MRQRTIGILQVLYFTWTTLKHYEGFAFYSISRYVCSGDARNRFRSTIFVAHRQLRKGRRHTMTTTNVMLTAPFFLLFSEFCVQELVLQF